MDTAPMQRLSAEDYFKIQETASRYNRSIDNGDKEEYLSIFTEDAVKESMAVWGRLSGKAELAKYYDEYFSSPTFAPYRGGQHRVTSMIVEDVQPGRVETWSTFIFVIPSGESPKLAAMGEYHDVFVKEGERWLIAQRVIKITSNLISRK